MAQEPNQPLERTAHPTRFLAPHLSSWEWAAADRRRYAYTLHVTTHVVPRSDRISDTAMKEQPMNVAIIVAIVALVSTIIGATIGAITNYTLAVRRERSDMERDKRNHAVEVKRAARLIDVELSRAEAAARICVEKGHWWSGDVAQLSTDAWQKHSGSIAPDLSDQAWLAVMVAIEAVDHIRTARAIAVDAGLEARPISDTTANALAPMLRDIKLGRAALDPFGRDSPPAAGK